MRRARSFLLVAFAMSLLVHVIVALVLRPARPTPEDQSEVVSIVRRPATIAVTRQTPPPRPARTPSPRTPSAPRPRASGGHAAPASSGGTGTPAPSPPPPTAPPARTTGACPQPSAAPAVLASPPAPDIAPAVRADATSGIALVRVGLDPGGQVLGASVTQSTGNASLDLVAVSMARAARYAPALHDCKPIAGEYTFSVKFVAW